MSGSDDYIDIDDNPSGETGGGTDGTGGGTGGGTTISGYSCPTYKKYTSCNKGYFMTLNGIYNGTPAVGNTCSPCPQGCTCEAGGTEKPICDTDQSEETETNQTEPSLCGNDYVGSLYHKLARYAMQTCVRPSESDQALPATVLQDINVVMDKIRVDMANALSTECERLGGKWIDTVWIDKIKNTTCCANGKCTTGDGITEVTDNCHDITGDPIFKKFYTETSANTNWGFCAEDHSTTSTEQVTTTQ